MCSSIKCETGVQGYGSRCVWAIMLGDYHWRPQDKVGGTYEALYDSKSTTNIAHNPIQHGHTKHIEMDRYFTKEKLENKLICTPYMSTKEQLADAFIGLNGHNFLVIT